MLKNMRNSRAVRRRCPEAYTEHLILIIIRNHGYPCARLLMSEQIALRSDIIKLLFHNQLINFFVVIHVIPGTYNLCDALPGTSKYPIVRLCDVPHTDSPLIPRHTIKIILPPKPYSMQEKKKSGRWTDSGFLSLFIISLYDR